MCWIPELRLNNIRTISRIPAGLSSAGGLREPIHAVVADNTEEGIRVVVTVYQPDLEEWEPGFRRRRKP